MTYWAQMCFNMIIIYIVCMKMYLLYDGFFSFAVVRQLFLSVLV